jgi:hypothetical protein
LQEASFSDLLFWMGISVMPVGLYFWIDGHRRKVGIVVTLLGTLLALLAIRDIKTFLPGMKFDTWLGLAIVILTWTLLAYDIYDRRKLKWLPELIVYDERNMEHLLRLSVIQQAKGSFIDITEPYVDVEVVVTNSSIFPVKPHGFDGRLLLNNQPLSRELELLDTRRLPVKHGDIAGIRMRQWLSKDSASLISKSSSSELVVGSAGILFSYTNSRGQENVVRISLGNLPFVVAQ